MSDEQRTDPSGNTEAFQAFVRQTGSDVKLPSKSTNTMAIAIGAIATLIIVAAIIWFVAS